MGDTNMCTNNPVLLKRTQNLPTIICLQKKAAKIVPTEHDIIESNKIAFNDKIGTVTNRVTTMDEVKSGFNNTDKEYKVLEYRIMCGQHFQQCCIDAAKGIIAKDMPSYWYSTRGIDEYGFTQDEIDFQKRIMASHKPYFMTYVYPALKTENNKYIKHSNNNAERRFATYGIHGIEDLQNYENKTEEMKEYLRYYYHLSPVGNNPCVVNRIAWLFESHFKQYLTRLSKADKDLAESKFDYDILKSHSEYSKSNYDKMYKLYKEYNAFIKMQKAKDEMIHKDRLDNWSEIQTYINWFQDECYRICSNEDELTDIVLDICYQHENGKQFAWDMCGNIILKNLLKQHNYNISYPYRVNQNGDFTYFGNHFNIRTITMMEE